MYLLFPSPEKNMQIRVCIVCGYVYKLMIIISINVMIASQEIILFSTLHLYVVM